MYICILYHFQFSRMIDYVEFESKSQCSQLNYQAHNEMIQLSYSLYGHLAIKYCYCFNCTCYVLIPIANSSSSIFPLLPPSNPTIHTLNL